jgi:DnaK suppressor protein
MVVRNKDELRRMLLEEQAYLTRQLKQMSEASVAIHDRMGYGNHMADDATEAFEQSKGLSLQQTIEQRLATVNRALHKFETDNYGVCEECGERIDWARLEALPAARLCIRCQHHQEWA